LIALTLALASLSFIDPAAVAGGSTPPPMYTEGMYEGPPDSSFNYRYAEGAILLGDFDGLRVGGSFPIQGPWIALGRFDYMTEEEGSVDVDVLLLSGGAGYVHTIDEKLDLIGSAEIEIGDIEVDGGGDDDDIGIRLRGGVRYQAHEKVELAGGLSFATVFDEELGIDGQALYAFNENIAGFVGFDNREDTVWTIGVRFNF
jgi:hypothetical protein